MPNNENGSPDTKGLTDRRLPNSQILRGSILPAASKLSQWHAAWISSTTIFRVHFLWRAERSLDAFRQALLLTAQVVMPVVRVVDGQVRHHSSVLVTLGPEPFLKYI